MGFLLYTHKGHKCNLDFYIFHSCKPCLSPICFGRAIIASTLFTNFYFYDFIITISHLFLERNTTMRVRATVLTLIHYPVLAGPRPNKRTAQYAGYIFHLGTDGSAECIPNKNILSARSFPFFHLPYERSSFFQYPLNAA